MARPPQDTPVTQSPSLLQFDLDQLVRNLRADGVAVAGILPPDLLSRVRAVTAKLPPGEYGDFDENPHVRAMVQCGATLAVARGYLRAEPALLECNLVVAHAENPADALAKDSQRFFHFDYAGWHSLNLFVYLTDVSEDSGAHQVVVGTHRTGKLRDALRAAVPDEQIMARYPGRIRTITGPAGTMFFEDTAAFHRRKMHAGRRVMLNILFASHRSWLSKGRLTVKYSNYLRSSAAAHESQMSRSVLP